MIKTFIRGLGFATVLVVPVVAYAQSAVSFQHEATIYADEKGGALLQPEGVACTNTSLLVADTGNGRLLRYTLEQGTVKGGTEIKIPELPYPTRVQMTTKGEIFALDGKTHRIVRLNADGMFKGYLDLKGAGSDTATIVKSFRIGASDEIDLLDVHSGRVLVTTPEGQILQQISLPGNHGFFSGIATDDRGTIFLIDSVNAMLFSAPKDANTFSPLTKSMREYLNFPTNLTVSPRGLIYVVDQNGGSILLLGPDGSVKGRKLSRGWDEGLLYYPTQLCVNEDGMAFVADRSNNRVQIFR